MPALEITRTPARTLVARRPALAESTTKAIAAITAPKTATRCREVATASTAPRVRSTTGHCAPQPSHAEQRQQAGKREDADEAAEAEVGAQGGRPHPLGALAVGVDPAGDVARAGDPLRVAGAPGGELLGRQLGLDRR